MFRVYVSPHFGAGGRILVQQTEGNANYLEQINSDGSHRSKIFPYPIGEIQSVSPGRRWATAEIPRAPDTGLPAIMAIPLAGGAPQRICAPLCLTSWSTDGKFLFVSVEDPSRTSPGRSLAIPLGPGESLPDLPVGGIAPLAEPSVVQGAESVGRGDTGARQGPRALCLGEHHGPPEPLSNLAALALNDANFWKKSFSLRRCIVPATVSSSGRKLSKVRNRNLSSPSEVTSHLA